MIVIKQKGNFSNIEKYLAKSKNKKYVDMLRKYGSEGVSALSSFTPVDSGETANSWDYEIVTFSGGVKIVWKNSNIVDGTPIAIILQYGHATKNGGYVQGKDYINPALRPIFEKMQRELWNEVKK